MNITILEVAGIGLGALIVRNFVKVKNANILKDTSDKKNNAPPNISQDGTGMTKYGFNDFRMVDTNINNGQPGVMMAESSLINQRNYEQNITQEKGKPYPIAFDPANDFLPRYRWPDGSVWSPAYNPVDSYRPLDYQLTTSLSEVVY